MCRRFPAAAPDDALDTRLRHLRQDALDEIDIGEVARRLVRHRQHAQLGGPRSLDVGMREVTVLAAEDAAIREVPFHRHRRRLLPALPASEAIEMREDLARADVGHRSDAFTLAMVISATSASSDRLT